MKPLLVGESNPYQGTEEAANHFALYPEPRRASGGRLCFDILGLEKHDYLRRFDRVDLCFPIWSLRAARLRAKQLLAERTADDVIVLFGARVWSAFVQPHEPFTIHKFESWPTLVLLPHPSGRNHIWLRRGVVERARAVLTSVGVL